MIDIKKVISILLVLCTLLSAIPYSAFALSWDGDSAGGSTSAVNGSSTGYVIRSTNDSNCVVGYRFSAVDSSGNMKVTKVIDVYRNTGNGDNAYSTSAKFSTKYNKKQIITNKNAKLTTTYNQTNCYKESSMGFTTTLPNPSGVETWQSYEANINKVLSKLGVGSVSNMNYGDKVIIEPLFDVCLAGEYQALTVSEIAYCGRSVLGGSSTGGTSNGTSKTWGFIASYTNRIWPNKLYTPDGQGLWTAASAIGSSSKATFDNIISKGYGAGIAYNETTNKTYTIKFNGNGNTGGSTASMTMTYGVAKNLTANGFTKTGNSFIKWNTKANGSGTSYTNKQSVKNLTSTQGATVNLYAQWDPYDLKVYYNANGGSIDSTKYYLSSKNVYKESDSKKYYQAWTYNSTKADGLVNASTFGLYKTGYRFTKWGTSTTGGTLFDQNDATIKPTDLNSSIKTGDCTRTLYAQWTPNTYTIKFNGNGSTSGSTAQMSITYDVAKNLTANGFTKSGYHFSGWNTKADGSGTSYYNKQSVKNLTATHGATITLYTYIDIINNSVCKSVCASSILESIPNCCDCVYQPYCGTYLCEAEKLAYIVDTSLEKEDFSALNYRLAKMVPVQKERIEYVFTNNGFVGNAIALVLTILDTLFFGYFLFIGIATALLSKTFLSIGLVITILSLIFIALNIFLIAKLVTVIKYKMRYNIYEEILGFKSMEFVEDIAHYSKQSETIVVKDLIKAINQKLIPQGHFTNNNLVFMVSDDVYEKYTLKPAIYDRYFQKQLENRQRTKARTKRINDIIETGEQYIKKLNDVKTITKEKAISKKIEHLGNVAAMIFHEIDVNPSTVTSLGVFLNYYLPTTEKLLDTYVSITEKKIEVPNLTKAKKEIENSLSTIIKSYELILEKLYEESEMNIKSEIEAMEVVMLKEST